MALTGNKGEWSEIYTLFRLLGEGKVHAGDASLNKLDLYYPIVNIIREESKRYEYRPDKSQNIVIQGFPWIDSWKSQKRYWQPLKRPTNVPLKYQLLNISWDKLVAQN